jgi:hypothetical protein
MTNTFRYGYPRTECEVIKTIHKNRKSLLREKCLNIHTSYVDAMKAINAAGFTEGSFREGLVHVNDKTKKPEKTTNRSKHFCLNNNVVPEDSVVTVTLTKRVKYRPVIMPIHGKYSTRK